MLRKLGISNYIIIDNQQIEFENSLNIITGETGAGKSILLGALALILGERADPKSLQDAQQKCVIEANFLIAEYHLHNFFTEFDLDYEEETIIRREIYPNGKSRAFVNDTPVNLNTLKNLGELLVNVHSQHETLSLSNPGFQLQLIDDFAQHKKNITEFEKLFAQLKSLQAELEQLKSSKIHNEELSFLKFQIEELESENLELNEQNHLETRLHLLENAEILEKKFQQINEQLLYADEAILPTLARVSGTLSELKNIDARTEEWTHRIESCRIELADIQASIEQAAESTFDEAENKERIEERLNTIYRFHKKHKTTSISELLLLLASFKEKCETAIHYESQEANILKKITALSDLLTESGKVIHEQRLKAAKKLENQVKAILAELAMPDAQFEVQVLFQNFEKLTSKGFDKIKFLFSANPGIAVDELHKVASGGELSRLMLALKSLAAQYNALPTLIFDEIDSGVSGEIGNKVGKQLEKLAIHHQVIVITHLPQIAAKKGTHFFVYKDAQKEQTFSRIKKLNQHERVLEIAKMLAGEKVTEAALKNAQAILNSK